MIFFGTERSVVTVILVAFRWYLKLHGSIKREGKFLKNMYTYKVVQIITVGHAVT